MTARLKFSIPTALVLLCTGAVRADVALPPVFSQGMVLQAELAVPIFGTAADGEKVTVEFSGQNKSTVAKDGKWKIVLDPLKPGAAPGGYPLVGAGRGELKIAGKNSITIKNVLVGEVWLASGQSNMKFPLARAADAEKEIAKADFAEVRYFVAPSGPWVATTPKTAGGFSAAAYYFAVNLHQRLRRPVGIIDSSVSGAVAQQFISPQAIRALEKDPSVAHALSQHGEPLGDVFQQSVAPLAPYGIRGAFWCQGEGNRDYPVTYRKLLATLIAEWRQLWGGGNFPFLIVQLANYGERKAEPWEGKDCAIREVQLQTAQAVPHCALIVAIDLGLAKDVHYPNKKPVGDRAALAARALAYGERIEYSGPLFQSAEFKDGKAIVSFTHMGGGLVAQGDKLKGFLLCGADKRFVRAEAAIDGDKLVVQSTAVSGQFRNVTSRAT
jgi:sialate O-acetylesterase